MSNVTSPFTPESKTPAGRKPVPSPTGSGHRNKDALARYLGDLASHPTFSPQQELAAARAIDAAEIAYWLAALSCSAALPTIAPHLEALASASSAAHTRGSDASAALDEVEVARARARDTERHWAERLARLLHQLDTDRQYMRKVYDAARSWWQQVQDSEDAVLVATAAGFQRRMDRAFREQNRAKQTFASANLRLVVVIAKRYRHSTIPLVDLIQEGNVGLMTAVERFDPSRGFRFSTYASWWIRHAVSRAVADKSRTVRLPVQRQEQLRRVARSAQKFRTRTGRMPTRAELSEDTGLSERQLDDLRTQPESTSWSLDRPVGDSEGASFVDLLTDDSATPQDQTLVDDEQRQQLLHLLAELKPIELHILEGRFGMAGADELTLRELGAGLGLSRERVRQLQNRALERLRTGMGEAERFAN